jgi:glycerophosphoryl diester phosphodiesterase
VTADLLLDPAARPVIGHRGASGLAPENTLEAFDLALSQGAEALEFDVRLSSDGVAMVIHDASLDRTTDHLGPIGARSLSELATVDAGARFSPDGKSFPYRGRGVCIPTLRQVLERYPGLPLLVEVKVPEAQEAVRADLIGAGAERRVVVASFLHRALAAFREPPFQAGASRADIVHLVARAWIGWPAPPGPVCYAVPHRYHNRIEVPTARVIGSARKAGKAMHVWTVNDPILARDLWDRGVNGIITNHPALILAERDRPRRP